MYEISLLVEIYSIADRSSSGNPSISACYDNVGIAYSHDWRLCDHRRQCHGGLHRLRGTLILFSVYKLPKNFVNLVIENTFTYFAFPVTSLQVSPSHLLTASIMSAPAALAFSKLLYPEVEESKTNLANIVMPKR